MYESQKTGMEIMKIKFIEQWKFKMFGRSVPAVRAGEITDKGLIGSLELIGPVKKRANSLIKTWDSKGWEIDKYSQQITLINEKGISERAVVVSESGKTINLYTEPKQTPNLEEVIGYAATMDDIAESMDMGKSIRNILIGLVFGILVGMFVLGPIFTGMAQ
jgi:hypothetical protein